MLNIDVTVSLKDYNILSDCTTSRLQFLRFIIIKSRAQSVRIVCSGFYIKSIGSVASKSSSKKFHIQVLRPHGIRNQTPMWQWADRLQLTQ